MKTVSVSDAKNGLSGLLREVRGGATVVITDRGVPIARLAPMTMPTGVPSSAIELAQRGRLVLPAHAPTADWMELPEAAQVAGRSAVAVLLDERRESR